MKKFFALIAALALAACCTVLFVSCDKSSAPVDNNYYLYDEESGSYNNYEYISISGDKCVIYSKNGKDGKGIKASGAFEITEENKFKAESVYKITRLSDLLSDKEVKEFEEESGVKNSEVTFDAQIKTTVTGRKYKNAVKVYSQRVEISGFKGIFSFLNNTISDSSTEIYCQKGTKPDFSVTLTYDLCGGALNGKSSVTVKTDENGKIVFPDGTPTRDDCEFMYFAMYKDIGWSDSAVPADTVFAYDATLYARWKQLYKVTFISNSVEYGIAEDKQTVIVKDGEACPVPQLIKRTDSPTTRLKGWFIDDKQILVGRTLINSDCTVKAQWCSAKEVADYNGNIATGGSNNHLYVHVVSQNGNGDYIPIGRVYRIRADGTEGSYSLNNYDSYGYNAYGYDACGAYMEFNLSVAYSGYDGEYDFLGCSLKLCLDRDPDGKFREVVIPKSLLSVGKPSHVFYNVDTGALGDKW